MKYLAVNGKVQTQSYTYFLYENSAGETQEIPAYCVNPNQYGVPQTVAEGESIRYLAEEKASDPKVVGLVARASATWRRKRRQTPRWWAWLPTCTPTAPWRSWG